MKSSRSCDRVIFWVGICSSGIEGGNPPGYLDSFRTGLGSLGSYPSAMRVKVRYWNDCAAAAAAVALAFEVLFCRAPTIVPALDEVDRPVCCLSSIAEEDEDPTITIASGLYLMFKVNSYDFTSNG